MKINHQFNNIFIGATLAILLVMPIFVSAAPSAGIKPSSIFYFFDTFTEKASMFFTFNTDKKVQRALDYAEERLAEAGAVAQDNNTNAVKTAMNGYESNISFATEKSKDVGEKEKAEALLTTISDSTLKHQEVLTDILAKVPDEAKDAIIKAIETSRKGHEEALTKIAELKSEVEQLKHEVAELKNESNSPRADEVEKLKQEVEALKKQSTNQPMPKQSIPTNQNLQEQKKSEEIARTTTLPSGAVVEMDANGNIISTIKEAPQQTYTAPIPASQAQTVASVQISSVNITPTLTTAKIEWQTDQPTESKIFLSGGGLSSKIYNSVSGLSTRHSVLVENLAKKTDYSYEIEAIGTGGVFNKKSGSFSTVTPVPTEIKLLSELSNIYSPIGAGCQNINLEAAILDQDGEHMPNQEITIFTSMGSLTKTTNETMGTLDKHYYAGFSYNPISTSTVEIITFTSGNLSITTDKIKTRNAIEERFKQGYGKVENGRWYYDGLTADAITLTCSSGGIN